jgi:guanylate kinase
MVIAVVGASCAGKTTLVEAALAQEPRLGRPVTTTTRAPRPGEVDGVSYHFTTPEAFAAAVDEGAFVESATYAGQSYGLTWAALEAVTQSGRVPLVILDTAGVRSLLAQADRVGGVLAVGIAAPLEDITARITAERPAEQVAARVATAIDELRFVRELPVCIENPNGAQAASEAAFLGAVRQAAFGGPVTPPRRPGG